MSSSTTLLNTGSQIITKYDLSKIFVYNNRYDNMNYVNSGYDDVTLAEGTVMGKTTAGVIVPLQSNASDGSQIPVGILACDAVINAGDSVNLPVCVSGDVVSGKIVLVKVGDTLSTIISSRSIRDRIGGDTVGVKVVESTENTYPDNS